MTEPTDTEIPGQEAIEIPSAQPAPVVPEAEPVTPDSAPDPTSDAQGSEAAQDQSLADNAEAVSTETEPAADVHKFRIIHELHDPVSVNHIIRLGEELAQDAEGAIRFLQDFVTKS